MVQGSASRSWHSYYNKNKLTPAAIGLCKIQNTPLSDHNVNYEGIRVSAETGKYGSDILVQFSFGSSQSNITLSNVAVQIETHDKILIKKEVTKAGREIKNANFDFNMR